MPLTEIQKKMFTVLSASFDGYLRLYKIKETKNLEIVAQINVMDKILSTIPLQLNAIQPNSTSASEGGSADVQSIQDELLLSSV